MAVVASRASESFVIEGGRPLNGTIRAAGNKNGALPILAACLLTDEEVRLTNVPHIRDVETSVELNGRYEMRADALRGKQIFLDEASVMATENAVMAAALAPGQTVIGNAACEPHVQDLCRFLVARGATIEGIGSNLLRIEGAQRLHGGEWRIGPEHIEVCSFIGLAAVTGGEMTIEGVVPEDLVPVLPSFGRLGVHVELNGTTLRVPPEQRLVIQDDLGGQIPKIEDGPWA